ncbi:PilZ domain-containing protein [Desulfogranum japonicum]|uniref:PilZ domain-containing protein n=1 Tax=Desulfogranum japonicum TaxID=231447 RepID=UPI00041172A7|nr:PilZ domain-containing protein [Desulfogranum japonicum]
MTSFFPPRLHPEKRRYSRVVFTRTVRLFDGDVKLGEYAVRNLSIGGLYLEGASTVQLGQTLRIELHETGHSSSLILNFYGRATRRGKTGVGMEFVEMEDDSFMFLQTMVLYASDDPIGVAEDFLEDFAQVTQENSKDLPQNNIGKSK